MPAIIWLFALAKVLTCCTIISLFTSSFLVDSYLFIGPVSIVLETADLALRLDGSSNSNMSSSLLALSSSNISYSGSPSASGSSSSQFPLCSFSFHILIYLSELPVANITPNCLSILLIVLMLLLPTTADDPVGIDSWAAHLSCLFFSFHTLTTPSLHPEYIILLSMSVSRVLIQSL